MSAHQADEALETGASPGEAREWACLACSGASGEGVQAGVEWLVAAAKRAVAVRRGKAKQPAAPAQQAVLAAPAAEPAPEAEPRSSGGGV
jgi:hypothetical protein